MDKSTSQKMYAAALAAGIVDLTYDTVREGKVASYRGEATFQFEGDTWKAIGHRPSGSPDRVSRSGWIEFIHQ